MESCAPLDSPARGEDTLPIMDVASQVRATACNRDCPDACAVLVRVEDGRAVQLRGDPADPITRGFLCERTARFLERQYSPDRILQPRVRRGERWVDLGWDDALDLAAERLRDLRDRHGAQCILHYRSGGTLGLLGCAGERVFERFGPVAVKRGDICSGAGEAAQARDFGVSESHALEDLLHSRCIVVWGKNPFVSGPHLLPVLREAKRRGACLIGIDPVRTALAPWCEVFLQPRPGTDRFLALAVARRLLDRGTVDSRGNEWCDGWEAFQGAVRSRTFEDWCEPTELEPAAVAQLADRYAELAPAAILVGWGMQRRADGGALVRTLDALAALRGNLGVAGGGVSFYFGRRSAFELGFLENRPPRTFSEPCLGPELLSADPPVRGIWVTAGNPVSMLPDSGTVAAGFARSEFNVVVETHPTDTTDAAHLVLPTCTLLESDDLLGAYGNHRLRMSRAAVSPPDGVRSEYWIFQQLARRWDLDGVLPESQREAEELLLRRVAEHGVTWERLHAERSADNPLVAPVLFADRTCPTPNGRMQILDDVEPTAPTAIDPEFPLRLHALSDRRAQASQWPPALRERTLECRVHPDVLRDAGFSDGERLSGWLESQRGRLAVALIGDPTLHREMALVPKGGMERHGQCANRLIAARETDLGGGACFYDEPVRISPREP